MGKKLPNPDTRIGSLVAALYGTEKWEVLKTALKLGVFDTLSESRTAEEVASILCTHVRNTEYLLNALVSLGYLTKREGCYQNTPLAESLLTSDKETSVGPSLLYLEKWIRSVLNDGMLDLVRNGPPPPEPLDNEYIWKAGVQAMLNQDRCGRAQRIALFVTSLPEFSSFKRMLDIGAGSGIMSIAIAIAHPSLRCFLLDRPAVCSIAEKVVAEYNLNYRIQAIRGDYMKDPIGTDYDFIMANYTLNFYRERLDEIVSKAYQALKPGGIFLVTSDALNRDKTAPTSTVMSWLAIWLQGMDMSFGQGVVSVAMREAGFESTESQILEGGKLDPYIPVEMIVGRKGK